MNPYVAGLLTFPVAGAALWLTGTVLVRAWDAWEKLLTRSLPKWYPVDSNAEVGAAIGTYSGRIIRIGFPGGGIFVVSGRGSTAPLKVRVRALHAIRAAWKDVAL